ncbi:hypothetical protein SAMN05216267_101856 [Actinacidiphila rubida]|uniref:MmpS family membrane protein n=1 Tax=Actinacidiphila rubida TaxID=310780 RepID=A0A1H8M8A7_9ACTN|nr:hypothetical protein SAMN05216267_101856 [Actinacidiphila rubida]
MRPEPEPEPEPAAAQPVAAEGPGVPPPGGHHLTPPPRRKWPWVVGLLALLIVGAITALAVSANHQATQSVTVRYSVTGTAHSVGIAYSTYDNQVISQTKVTAATLPWNKVITTDGFTHGGALTVTLGASGGTASCTVVADGKTYTATASGPHSAAQCRGF